MRIAAAQTRPIAGSIDANVQQHIALLDLTIPLQPDAVFFPELSITGYEPTLAADLATDERDERFDVIARHAANHNTTIGIGLPTRSDSGIHISMALFFADGRRDCYSKMHLHSTETPYFVPGPKVTGMLDNPAHTALAICYELSVPEHAANAAERSARTYAACAVEPIEWIERTHTRLEQIAAEHEMAVLFADCLGESGGYQCAGRSAAWAPGGQKLGELDGQSTGVLLFDTDTLTVEKRISVSN